MATIKLTKNEFKKQKDQLKMFSRYLPTLQLKKQQLQLEIREFQENAKKVKILQEKLRQELTPWLAVFAQKTILDSETLVQVESIHTTKTNIAGVSIPVFHSLNFRPLEFDLFLPPAWVSKGILALQNMVLYDAQIIVLDEAVRRLEDELLTTTQRVNLFEKVKIPETKRNLKKIAVYLGDQQTASVVRGKITKKKLEGRAS